MIEQGARLLLIRSFLPGSAQYVRQIVEGIIETCGQVGMFSILLIWSGSRLFDVITMALNIAYGVSEPHGFIKRTPLELVVTFTVALMLILAVGSQFLISLLLI